MRRYVTHCTRRLSPLAASPGLFPGAPRYQHFSMNVDMPDESKKYSLFPSATHTARLMRYMWPPGRPDIKVRVATALTLMVATKFLTVSIPVVFKTIVDSMSPDVAIAAVAYNPLGLTAVSLAISYGLVRLSLNIIQELRYAIFTNVTTKALNEIGVLVFRTLLRQDVSFHVARRTGGLSRQVDRGMRGVSTLINILVFMLVPTFIELLLVCSLLQSTLGPSFAVTAFGAVALYSAFTFVVTEWRAKFRVDMNALDTKSSALVVDSLMNYEAVRLYNHEEHEVKRYADVLAGYYVHSERVTWSYAFLNFGQGVIMSGAILAITVMSIHGIQAGTMTVGGLVMVNALMIQLSIPLNFLGSMYRELSTSSIDMQSLFELLDHKMESEENCTKYVYKGGKIEFKDVIFSYPATGVNGKSVGMLKNVSFVIQPGHVVGLVGPTASGKSTALKLLTKFYLPGSGRILLDDQDISTITAASLREHMGVVSQENLLFNDTIEYNISYGKLTASNAEIEAAAKAAAVHDGIMALENKYQTVVGERGARLSGGERQRIGLARVLLKNPHILLADEATSALDTKTEGVVMGSLKARGRTVVLIAHRLSTVMDADMILVFKEGGVAECGTHEQLLSLGGLYYEMWQRQLKDPVT